MKGWITANTKPTLVILAIVAILLAGSTLWTFAQPTGWGPASQTSEVPGDSRLADLLMDSTGVLHLVWQVRSNVTLVYYMRSLDNGLTWTSMLDLDLGNGSFDPMPRLASNGEDVAIVYSNRTTTGVNLFYIVSHDDGANFSSPMQLTNQLDVYDTHPSLDIVGQRIAVAWSRDSQEGESVYYIVSPNTGREWAYEVKLSSGSWFDRYPAIAADNQVVTVVWDRLAGSYEEVVVRCSYDNGADWQPETILYRTQLTLLPDFPNVATDGRYVYAVWSEGYLFYSESADGGRSWSFIGRLTIQSQIYLAPQISASNARVAIAASVVAFGRTGELIYAHIYYLESENNGVRWTPSTDLTDAIGNNSLSLAPTLTIRRTASFVAWENGEGGRDAIFLKVKPDFAAQQHFRETIVFGAALAFASIVLANVALTAMSHPSKRNRRRKGKSGRGRRRAN